VTPSLVLVDSNVLIDIFTADPRWFDWSARHLEPLITARRLAINPIIYAEVSVQFDSIEALEAAMRDFAFARLALPYEAGFLAGKAFVRYRGHGGARHSPLPDFYIGAHAALAGLTLLTRDARRYRRYFPKLNIISPAGAV
jgi:predicted nucleic acid-binding protein